MKTGLALERERLVRRSQLARVQLRREARMVRESLHWRRTAATVAGAPVMRNVAVGIALTFLGAGRASRIISIVGRVLLAAQLGRALLGGARGAAANLSRRYRTAPRGNGP